MNIPQKLKYLLVLLLLCASFFSEAQINNEARHYYPEFEEQRSHQLLLHLANVNFVKNNEYKNKFAWGHTLIGYGIQPSLMYYAGDRLRLQAGVFLQQYSGLNYYSEIRPVLSAHLRVSSSVDLIMGSLKGHVHHDVIEPLFDTERQYIRPVENGIQFLINRPWLDLDLWVDWEQFVQEGDDFPEWFTAGLSATPQLLDTLKQPWKLSVPVNMMAVHRGGEVSTYPERVQTSMNLALGLHLERKMNGLFNDAGLFVYGMNYNNLNKVGLWGVNNGYAWYVGATANTTKTNLMVGYFYGHDFVALRGGGIFQSVSPIRDHMYIPTRQLVTIKFAYNRMFLKKIKFSFLFEGYYDIPDARFDFAPGIQLVFSPSFFLTEAEFF